VSQRRSGWGNSVQSPFSRWLAATARDVRSFPEPQLGRGFAQPAFLRARHLGTLAAGNRSIARAAPRRGRKPQSRDDDAGERCRDELLRLARARLRTRYFEAHVGNTRGIAP